MPPPHQALRPQGRRRRPVVRRPARPRDRFPRAWGYLPPKAGGGAGKSTTIRALLGLDTPDAGLALIGGQPYRRIDRPLRRVGALLDAGAVHKARTARAHLAALAASNHIPRGRVEAVLDLVGLSDVAGRRAGAFSLGMKQRLGIAAALLGDPPVLIFDEPVNGLDPEGIRWIRTLMRSLAAEGRTVLVSSHLIAEMSLTADHLLVIGRGRLLADIATEAFVPVGASLEDAYLRLTEAAVEYRTETAGGHPTEGADRHRAATAAGHPTEPADRHRTEHPTEPADRHPTEHPTEETGR